MLYLGPHAYFGGKDLYLSRQKGIIYLSAKGLFSTQSIGDYISSHKISKMLEYILVTEGWTVWDTSMKFRDRSLVVRPVPNLSNVSLEPSPTYIFYVFLVSHSLSFFISL